MSGPPSGEDDEGVGEATNEDQDVGQERDLLLERQQARVDRTHSILQSIQDPSADDPSTSGRAGAGPSQRDAEGTWLVGRRELIYNDPTDGINVYLVRERFQRQLRFAQDDHLYRVTFEWDSSHVGRANQSTFGTDILRYERVIHQVLRRVFELVVIARPSHSLSSKALITIVDRDSQYTLNTGAIKLTRENLDNEASNLMAKLSSTLQSHQQVHLNAGFKIFVKVLSSRRIEEEEGPNSDWLAGGQSNQDVAPQPPSLALPSHRLPRSRKVLCRSYVPIPSRLFPDQCMLAAFTYGYAHRCHLTHMFDSKQYREESQLYKKIVKLNAELCRDRTGSSFADDGALRHQLGTVESTALNHLSSFMEQCAREAGLPINAGEDARHSWPPVRSSLRKLSDAFNVQVTVYNENLQQRVRWRYPREFRSERLPLALLEEERWEVSKMRERSSLSSSLLSSSSSSLGAYRGEGIRTLSHFGLLLNPMQYFSQRGGVPCNFCSKNITVMSRHRCTAYKRSCFACKRFRVSQMTSGIPNVHIDSSSVGHFCFRKGEWAGPDRDTPLTETVETCPQCNVKMFSNRCKVLHTRSYCNRGFFCPQCRIYTWGKNTESAKESHVCHQRTCYICRETYIESKRHTCTMSKEKVQKWIPRLAVYDFETTTVKGVSDCQHCYSLEVEAQKKWEQIQSQLERPVAMDNCGSNGGAKEVTIGKAYKRLKTFPNFAAKSCGEVRCSLHREVVWSESTHRVNYAVLYYESRQRGLFNRVDFAEEAMQHPLDGVVEPDVLALDYWPDERLRSKYQCVERLLKEKGLTKNKKKKKKTEDAKPTGRQCGEESGEEHNDEDDDNNNDEHHWVEGKAAPIESRIRCEETLDCDEVGSRSAIGKFVSFVLGRDGGGEDVLDQDEQKPFHHFAFLAHNAGRFDMTFLLRAFTSRGYNPKLVSKDMKIISMEFESLQLRFLDSINYLPASLDKLAKTFHLPQGKGFFPHGFNVKQHYEYVGPCPDASYFHSHSDDVSQLKRKEEFVRESREEGRLWDFKKEMAAYCNLDVLLLTRIVCTYLRDCLALQTQIGEEHGRQCQLKECLVCEGRVRDSFPDFLHPFGPPYVTLSSYVYGTCRLFYTNAYNVYTIMDEFATCSVNSSVMELEVSLFFESTFPQCFVQSKFTYERPLYLHPYTVDVAVRLLDGQLWVIHVLGCYHHLHAPEACLSGDPRLRHGGGRKNYLGRTSSSLAEEMQRQKEWLASRHGVAFQTSLWECQWNAWKKAARQQSPLTPTAEVDRVDPIGLMIRVQDVTALATECSHNVAHSWWSKAIGNFFASDQANARLGCRPPVRLVPRSALRGGLVETFGLFWSSRGDGAKSTSEGESMYYVDVNSLYPATNFDEDNLYPSGLPKVLVSPKDLNGISFEHGRALLNGLPIRGLAQVSMLPPPYMKHPFLIQKVLQKKSKMLKNVIALCSRCAAKNSPKICSHSCVERSITDVYTLDEVAYAIEVGYSLVHLHEVLYYSEEAPLFRDYLRTMAREKVKYSGFPSSTSVGSFCGQSMMMEQEARNRFLDDVNCRMGFEPPLRKEEVQNNPTMRFLAKICSNALLGKIGQNSDKKTVVLINNQEDLNAVLDREDVDIVDAISLSDQVTQLGLRSKKQFRRINRKTNVVIAAHTTAWARIAMHRHLQTLVRAGCTLYYMDTDSFIFTKRHSIPWPLPMDDSIYGYFKDECCGRRIVSFVSLAPKFYSLRIANNEDGSIEELVKLRGFHLKQTRLNAEGVRHSAFLDYVGNLLRGLCRHRCIGQFGIRSDKWHRLSSQLLTKTLRNDCFSKRALIPMPRPSSSSHSSSSVSSSLGAGSGSPPPPLEEEEEEEEGRVGVPPGGGSGGGSGSMGGWQEEDISTFARFYIHSLPYGYNRGMLHDLEREWRWRQQSPSTVMEMVSGQDREAVAMKAEDVHRSSAASWTCPSNQAKRLRRK